MTDSPKTSPWAALSVGGFLLLLASGGLGLVVLPAKAFSEQEKRPLQTWPSFSWESLWAKRYTDSLEGYVSDQLPGRDYWLEAAKYLQAWRGLQSDSLGEYLVGFDVDAGVKALDEEGEEPDTPNSEVGGDPEAVENIGKLLFYNGYAIQRFGGTNQTPHGLSTEYSAAVAKEYAAMLKADGVQVYLAITPASGELLLPSAYKPKRESECENIRKIYANLNAEVKSVDICSELHRHQGEYLYFATDHHWTGRGAYYAYVAYCQAAGLQALPLDSLQRGVFKGFLGTLYRRTQDPRLAANPDSVEFFKVPNQHQAYKVEGTDYSLKRKKYLYVDFLGEQVGYGVFIGGDYPLFCVETDVANERTALVIKNSFGNAFAPYLAAHYKRVFVIDYRKFRGNMGDFCRKNKVTDLIIMHNSFSANTASHIAQVQAMLHKPQTCAVLPWGGGEEKKKAKK